MRFRKFIETFYESDYEYIPSKDEIRHFNQVRKGGKIDYSKDLLNQVLKKLYKITIQTKDEKLRDKFAHVIFKNMGDLDSLISSVKRLNDTSINNSKKDEIEKYIGEIENDLQKRKTSTD